MYIIKVKGKAKIPDYIQLRDEQFVLIAYFRADRPLKDLHRYGLEGKETELAAVISGLEFGKLQPLSIWKLMSEPVIELHDATILQEDQPVLQGVSFTLEKSEFCYLVGRTGSGKSSLLKTLYADLPLQSGTGTVAGFALPRLSPAKVPFLRRRLGIVFQDFQLLSDRTVAENLLFVLNATGWQGKARKQQRISDVLMQVGLSGAANRMPHRLSGGEQQRVVIARAMLNEPVLLLADEPTGNLDPEVSASIMKLFGEINNAGTAILMATHNFQLIEQHPHRVLTCKDGQLLDSARPTPVNN